MMDVRSGFHESPLLNTLEEKSVLASELWIECKLTSVSRKTVASVEANVSVYVLSSKDSNIPFVGIACKFVLEDVVTCDHSSK